jgi:hypothetical protein
MATLFKNIVVKNVGSQPVKVLETNAATRTTIIGLSLTNLTSEFLYCSVLLQDDTSVTGYYLKDTVIPANTSLRAVSTGEKMIVAPENILYVQSSIDDSIDVILSYVEVT